MRRFVAGIMTGVVIAALAGGLLRHTSSREVTRAAEPAGYTLQDVYGFISSNGGTNPVAGDHALYPTGAPGTGGMPTIEQIMGELRKLLPVQTGAVLPATGLARCSDTAGTVIDCGSAEWPGQDGLHHRGCPTAGRFTDNGNGTVTDNCTGLVWQKATAPGTSTWQDALLYCESLDLGGSTDWRLPNVRELQSLVDCGRIQPCVDPVFSTFSGHYWSSTSGFGNPADAWYVACGIGYASLESKDIGNNVRAVRN
jgi:hypothetical protein